MHRMKYRVENALRKHPIMMWRRRLGAYLWKFILRIRAAPSESWIAQSSMWAPNESEDPYCEYLPYRCRGRPSLKWDTSVCRYCNSHFNASWQELPIDVLRNKMDEFVNFFCAYERDVEMID